MLYLIVDSSSSILIIRKLFIFFPNLSRKRENSWASLLDANSLLHKFDFKTKFFVSVRACKTVILSIFCKSCHGLYFIGMPDFK